MITGQQQRQQFYKSSVIVAARDRVLFSLLWVLFPTSPLQWVVCFLSSQVNTEIYVVSLNVMWVHISPNLRNPAKKLFIFSYTVMAYTFPKTVFNERSWPHFIICRDVPMPVFWAEVAVESSCLVWSCSIWGRGWPSLINKSQIKLLITGLCVQH